jgi:hypothetical protein
MVRPCVAKSQHDGDATIQSDNVERVLADNDADDGVSGTSCLGHGVLLVFGTTCQLLSPAGQEHGMTIPLAGIGFRGGHADRPPSVNEKGAAWRAAPFPPAE